MKLIRLTQSDDEGKWPRLVVTWQTDEIGNWSGEGVVWNGPDEKLSWGHRINVPTSNGLECHVWLNQFGPGCLAMMKFPCLHVDMSHLTLITMWAEEVIRRFDIKGEVPRG